MVLLASVPTPRRCRAVLLWASLIFARRVWIHEVLPALSMEWQGHGSGTAGSNCREARPLR